MTDKSTETSHDELDKNEIDQLHSAVLQMSKSCFEYKKICVGLLGAAMALIVKLNENPVTDTLFIVALSIVISFWLADSTAYYYQIATRKRMNSIRTEIAERNKIDGYLVKDLELSVTKSLFNGSMKLYYSLATLINVAWLIYIGLCK